MLIRKAVAQDAAAIAAIAESVRYRPSHADPTRGYLVYVGTLDEYAARLQENDSSYLAEVDGQVVAFLLTTTSSIDTCTSIGCPEVEELIFGNSALLIDQIGVSPHGSGLGAAAQMFRAMVEEHAPTRMTACIMHWPVKNARSVRFFETKLGFKCIGEYHEGNGFLWGIYEFKKNAGSGDVRYPLGRFLYSGLANETDFAQRLERLRWFPQHLRSALALLEDVSQAGEIVHHIADCHQVLTEIHPRIKSFDEHCCAALDDKKPAPVEESLRILDSSHAGLTRWLDSHPEQRSEKLDQLLSYIDWHGRHNIVQILKLKK